MRDRLQHNDGPSIETWNILEDATMTSIGGTTPDLQGNNGQQHNGNPKQKT